MILRQLKNITYLLAIYVLSAPLLATSASAIIVENGSPAVFRFEHFDPFDLEIETMRYSCYNECDEATSPYRLAAGSSFQLNVGTTAGGNNLGTGTLTNSTSNDVNNFSSLVFSPAVEISGALTEFFITVIFSDDVFGIENLTAVVGEDGIEGRLVQQSSPIPVPAALPLFGTGLAIMGFLGWRRKRRVAA